MLPGFFIWCIAARYEWLIDYRGTECELTVVIAPTALARGAGWDHWLSSLKFLDIGLWEYGLALVILLNPW